MKPIWIVAVAAFVTGCGGSSGSQPSPTPTPPATPTVTSLQLGGSPESLSPGGSAQLTATAALSNGTTSVVTGQANWQSMNAGVATISGAGLVTAVAPGTAEIRASYQTVNASLTLEVKTASATTFAICGNVTETGGAPIPKASIDVRDGLNARRNAESDDAGHYCLRELLPDSFTLRAGKNGYEQVERGLTLTADATQNFSLPKVQAGMFSLCGTATESPSGGALSGVLVEVRTGANTGRTTTSDSAGRYCLAGLLADSFTVRASRANYDTAERSIALSGDATLNFGLLVTRPTVTLNRTGASPSPIIIAIGQRVTFVNNDSVSHDMASNPHPIHTDCPEINGAIIVPGASRQTAVFTRAVTCGYHDHLSGELGGWPGTIVVR